MFHDRDLAKAHSLCSAKSIAEPVRSRRGPLYISSGPLRRERWTAAVLERHGFRCCVSGKVMARDELEAHHLWSFAHHPRARYYVLNGRPMARDAHRDFHNRFMKGSANPTTPTDLRRYFEEVGGALCGPFLLLTPYRKPTRRHRQHR